MERNPSRRRVLKGIGMSAGLAVGLSTSAAAKNDKLPKGLAKKAARKQVQAASGDHPTLDDWNGASVGKPTTFYRKNAGKGPAYLRSAYVFPVLNGSTEVGYITTAARRSEGPVIEYSPGPSPATKLKEINESKVTRGKSTTKPLYHGGVQYFQGFVDDTVMNVRNGRSKTIGGIAPDYLSSDSAPTQWETIRKTSTTSEKGLVPTSDDVTTMGSDYVPYVPAWTETDAGNYSWTRVGDGPDAWDNWDGCTPIAASMLIASHENAPRPENDYGRERMIDLLHREMNTSHDGWTTASDARVGINNYDYGNKKYYANYHGYTSKRKVRNHVAQNKPLLFNIHGGSNNWDHTVTVVGYKNSGNRLRIHNTYGSYASWYSWGDWNNASMISVNYSN